MLEKLPFLTLVLSAWRATLSKRLPWIFGFILAFASVLESQLGGTLPDTASFQEFLNILAKKDSETLLFFLLIFVFLFVLEIFGKSNLIVSLSFVTGKTRLPNHPNNPASIGRNFSRALLLECLALLFLVVVIGIFSLPLLVASSQNPGVMDALLRLGFLAFLPIAIAVFFISQFSLYYLLLSPLKLRGSLEIGSSLFSRFIFRSLIFGFFSFMLTALFTFCVNIVIRGFTAIAKKAGLSLEEAAISIGVSLVFFAWFSIFQQALWLAFFKSIAGPHKTQAAIKEKEPTLDNQILPEIPPAQ